MSLLLAMIFVKDAATLRFVRFNKAGEQLLGYRREELICKSDHDLFPAQQADFFALKDRAVLESRQMVDVPEEPLHTRHGPRLLHTMKIPIVDVRGEPRFLLGISRDITEQKRAEAELRESERRYREVQMALAHANRVSAMPIKRRCQNVGKGQLCQVVVDATDTTCSSAEAALRETEYVATGNVRYREFRTLLLAPLQAF